MPAKWQTWMPFHIDRWRGSPMVQGMPPAGRYGYLMLLAAAWQSDDCSLPDNAEDLELLSQLYDDWKQYGPRILRSFTAREDGRLVNRVLLQEWGDAKRVFDSRRESADKTNSARSPHGHRTVTARRADTRTRTETGTETKEQPLAPRKRRAGASHQDIPTETHAQADSHPAISLLTRNEGVLYHVTAEQVAQWATLFLAVDVPAELRKMCAWLQAHDRNRKSYKGTLSFITGWLTRAQDRAPVQGRLDAGVGTRLPERVPEPVREPDDNREGAQAIWRPFLRELEATINRQTFDTFLKPMRALALVDGVLIVSCLTVSQEVVRSRFAEQLARLVASNNLAGLTLWESP